ncbi:MAG: hypothetical protein RRX92_04940 [Lachnospiraceae bacterium]
METRLTGVSIATKKDHSTYYRASITHKQKHISLGSFNTMEEAHAAYAEALMVLADTDLSIHHYAPDAMNLSFDKWVSLINYRDNLIYFCNPIYVNKNFFTYYLSPLIELIFDMDDLFYYSSHKIMKRLGHLFVADYGMQVTIASRYGIKNYSVLNRDYRFINGNIYDYRYENIEIINRYQGVQKIKKKNQIKYQVTIHVHSNYRVGCYSSEEKAAVAYNKAIDILHKQGIKKHYTPNYIESLTKTAYADIYADIKVSPKLYYLNS